MIDNSIASGDNSLLHSKSIVKRTTVLIKNGNPLFDEIESGATNKNQQHIQKLLRKKDVINAVFPDSNKGIGSGGGILSYSPAELRKLEELPETAPSQRPFVERKTNINDDVWNTSSIVYGERELNKEDKSKNTGNMNKNAKINMDDIWEVTGALPPEFLSALEDPYDAWNENELKPVQKPLRDDEEEEYRDKLKHHFKERRNLLTRKYWLPRWCRYIVWIILITMIILFMFLFLFEGNKLGAKFLWVADEFNNTNCTVSISEQQRFDYDYSLDEAARRNPACSPEEINGSMPHCWDYRVRFTIASLITFLTSVLLVQPLYIAILSFIVLALLPTCKPMLNKIRNLLCCRKPDGPGYKRFIGGSVAVSGDTVLEYGQLADEEISRMSDERNDDDDDNDDEDDEDDDDDNGDDQYHDPKKQPLLN